MSEGFRDPVLRAKAKAKADAIRSAQAALKQELRRGELTLGEALVDERVSGALTVSQLLRCMHRWGDWRVKRVLLETHISPDRKVRQLTERQREDLVQATGRRARAAR